MRFNQEDWSFYEGFLLTSIDELWPRRHDHPVIRRTIRLLIHEAKRIRKEELDVRQVEKSDFPANLTGQAGD